MMKRNNDLWFLHLSDFHINVVGKGKELLRKGHYEDFIEGFSTKVLTAIKPAARLAGVIFTGDLINKGKVQNLAHATKVLDCLCKQLAIEPDRLVGCHGNHDFKLAVANTRSYAEAIQPVKKVLNDYGKPLPDCHTPLGDLHEIESGVFILTLDSLLNHPDGAAGSPGEPSSSHEDSVVEMLRSHVTADDVLLIATHYPLDDFNESSGGLEERLWQLGRPLADRIATLRGGATAATLWLSGDLHYPLKPRYYGIFTCLLGGHWAGRPMKKSLQKPAAVLFRLRRGTQSGECVEIELRQGHTQKASGGVWWGSERMSFPERSKKARTRKSAIGAADNSVMTNGGVNDTLNAKLSGSVERFDDSIEAVTGGAPSLETKIRGTIAREGLYHLGRFETANERVSLGWVSIGRLLAGACQPSPSVTSSTPLLPLMVVQMTTWLAAKRRDLGLAEESRVVLLGIDSWGAVLASQISIMFGWRNFCIAGRAAGAHHTRFERVTDRVVREAAQAALIVLVTDVIASGRTLRRIQDEVINRMASIRAVDTNSHAAPLWIAASVLCDEMTTRGDALALFQKVGCASKSLRMPLIPREELPNEGILPARLRFTREEESDSSIQSHA